MKTCILDKGDTEQCDVLPWLLKSKKINEISIIKNTDMFIEKVLFEIPDVVFLRLSKKEKTGLQTASTILKENAKIKVIFLADEDDYALEAYEIGAYNYLLCPVQKRKIEKCFTGL